MQGGLIGRTARRLSHILMAPIQVVIRKAKRKDIYQADRLRFDDFVKGRATVPGKSVKDLTSGRPDAAVYTIKTAQQLVYIEPCEDFLNEMKKYYHGL